MTHRQNIGIEYCPQCQGAWLDEGQLDKIIERSQQGSRFIPQHASQTPPDFLPSEPAYAQSSAGRHGKKYSDRHNHSEQQSSRDDGHRSQTRHQIQSGHEGRQPHRKKSFWQQMFE